MTSLRSFSPLDLESLGGFLEVLKVRLHPGYIQPCSLTGRRQAPAHLGQLSPLVTVKKLGSRGASNHLACSSEASFQSALLYSKNCQSASMSWRPCAGHWNGSPPAQRPVAQGRADEPALCPLACPGESGSRQVATNGQGTPASLTSLTTGCFDSDDPARTNFLLTPPFFTG